MNVIWDLGKVAIKEVVSSLLKERNLAYATVVTVMKILEQKDFSSSLTNGGNVKNHAP